MDFELLAQAQKPFPVFPEQVSTDQLAQNIVYAVGTVGALIILAGLLLVDLGGVRRVNLFESTIEKVIGFFIGFAVYYLIGFAMWQWQYYVAFDVPDPYWQAVKDWFLGGNLTSEFAHRVDPAVAPGLNNSQVFIFFLACFAGIINVLIHLSVTERIKPAAYYIISFVAAIVSSALSWLTWGSTGPITNLGYHDFFGAGFVYLFSGGMALVLAQRVGQRPGVFQPHPQVPEYRSYNLGLTTTGVVLVFAGLPMVILSCGYFFDGALFVSVTMAESGLGVAFNNLGLAWAGGALTGALIAYMTKKMIYTLLGPFAGYVSGAPGFDIYEPWQMFLVALGAPIVSYAVYETINRRGIDEHKLIPLFVGAGTYGLLMVGAIKWNTPQSGFFGLETGDFAFQHAKMNIGWQLLGVGVSLGAGIVTATVLALLLERTIGLRVSEEVQVEGYDRAYWQTEHEAAPVIAAGPATAAGQAGSGFGSGLASRPEPGPAS